ncbi:nucleotidyltransferase domain-containing protein [Parendozoicomonas haliclonae]|uniref:Cyclic GMP-AMP synthase n=1 Tax=Parendozoicomonas haliclonae TaxID=1960125 RepID=A0A1X7AK90_9GAMM|nr:nucleotidyltransferase [Parendozoicomonas haliclonae]SMA46632.1 hypothetical protein EHSB41UT_02218 [Parendozoicomonas haliclonae]
MAIQKHFNQFDENIYLSRRSSGYKKAKAKDESILDEIKTAFKEAGYPVIETFLQGSFAVDTAISSLKSDYDIDRALVIDASKAPEDPVEPKQVVLKVLEDRNFKNPKIKKPCITADYQSIDLHIDYTVYKKGEDIFGNNAYHLAVGKAGSDQNNKEWSPSDPRGLIGWIRDVERYGAGPLEKGKQYKRLVRYMKRWRDFNFNEETGKKLFSIGLTVMLKEQYKPGWFSSEIKDDLVALKEAVDGILDDSYIRAPLFSENYRVFTELPKKPHRDIFQHKVSGGESEPGSDLNLGEQLKNKLTKLQAELQKAIDQSCEIKQCSILNMIFGDDFAIPEADEKKKAASLVAGAALFASAGASGTSQGA